MNHHDINRITARHWKTRVQEINRKTRINQVLFPRLAAMLLCRQVLNMTLHQIRRAYSKKAVSTIYQVLQSACNLYDTDKHFRSRYDAAKAEAIRLLPVFRSRRQRYNLHYRIRQKEFVVNNKHKAISITQEQEHDLIEDPQLRRLLKEHNYSVQYSIL